MIEFTTLPKKSSADAPSSAEHRTQPAPAKTPPPADTSVIEFTPSAASSTPSTPSAPPSLSREKREEVIRAEMRHMFRKSESDEITENLFKTVLEYRLEKSE